jgi:hypothetical protein
MTDVQSLTLRKATSRTRRRFRRPRRPNLFWLLYVLWCAVFAVFDVVTGAWVFAIGQLIFLGGAWPVLLRRRPAIAWPVVWLGVGVFLVACVLALVGVG